MSIIEPKNVLCSNLFPMVHDSGSGQSSFNPYDLSRDDEEYLTSESVAETTPRPSNHAARLLTAPWLYLNPQPEAPKN